MTQREVASGAQVTTIRDGSAYRVYVGGVERAYVPLREISNSVVTVASRDGSNVAIIPDHDSSQGESLMVLDVASGELNTLFRGPVTSAAFSADGKLAYAVETAGGASVRIGTATSAGRPVADLVGSQVDLLGFSADGLSLFATVYPDRQDQGVYAPSVVRVSTTDGQTMVVLEGDPVVSEQRYSDIRLIQVNGQDRLSYIRSSHQLCVGMTDLALATTDGQVVQSFRPTTEEVYRSAAWSADGNQIAYAVQQCPNKAEIVADRDAAIAKQAQGTGVFVADVASGQATRVVEGIPSAKLLALDEGMLRLGSDREGVASVDSKLIKDGTQAALKAESVLAAKITASDVPSQMARTNMAKHVHQVYDTRDAFDGRGSCGPTTAVMTMAGYQLAEWGMYVNYGGYHYTGWGRYVTDAYSYNGTTFNRTKVDYSGRGSWAGAHGWIYDPTYGAIWSWFYDYLNRHTNWALQHAWDPTWIRNEINRGQLIGASTYLTSAGHFVLIKGYTDDGRWVVNDPYGPNSSGGPGGADQIYTTTQMDPRQVWSN